MKSITVPAERSELDKVQEFIEKELSEYECSSKIKFQIDLVLEEIFVNIASYAYSTYGETTICCEVNENPLSVTIQFLDNGNPYNPLDRKDPDVSLSADERGIGGLGIFLVKKSMDDINYEYKNGKNILTIVKKLKEQ